MIEKWVEKRWHTIKTYKHGWNRIFLSCTKQHMKLLSKALKRENSSSSSYLLLKNVEHFRRMIFNFHHDGVVLIVVDWKKFSTANTMNHEPWKVYLCNVFKIPNALNRIERTKNQLNVSKNKTLNIILVYAYSDVVNLLEQKGKKIPFTCAMYNHIIHSLNLIWTFLNCCVQK